MKKSVSFTVDIDVDVVPDDAGSTTDVLQVVGRDLLAEIRRWAARSDTVMVANSAHLDFGQARLPGALHHRDVTVDCQCGWQGAGRIQIEAGDSGVTGFLLESSCPGCGRNRLTQHRLNTAPQNPDGEV